jgi:hypothetical protein
VVVGGLPRRIDVEAVAQQGERLRRSARQRQGPEQEAGGQNVSQGMACNHEIPPDFSSSFIVYDPADRAAHDGT